MWYSLIEFSIRNWTSHSREKKHTRTILDRPYWQDWIERYKERERERVVFADWKRNKCTAFFSFLYFFQWHTLSWWISLSFLNGLAFVYIHESYFDYVSVVWQIYKSEMRKVSKQTSPEWIVLLMQIEQINEKRKHWTHRLMYAYFVNVPVLFGCQLFSQNQKKMIVCLVSY